jgi:hypothetical protein
MLHLQLSAVFPSSTQQQAPAQIQPTMGNKLLRFLNHSMARMNSRFLMLKH